MSVDLNWARANQCVTLLELNGLFIYSFIVFCFVFFCFFPLSDSNDQSFSIYNARQIPVLGI